MCNQYCRNSRGEGSSPVLFYAVLCVFVLLLRPACVSAQSSLDQVQISPRTFLARETDDVPLNTHTRPFSSKVELVLVPVSVSDRMNRPVLGLDANNFQVFDDKQPQSIDHFSSEDVPTSLAIVLDESGSMAERYKIDRAREAVFELLKASNPEDEILLISVSDKPELLTGFTTSVETIQAALVYISPKGSTALLDGIYVAMSQMKTAKYSRKALVIVSDGGDNHSRYNEHEILDLVKESDVLIYSIGIYDEFFQSEEERMGPLLLSDVSELTGRRFFTVNNPNDLADVAIRIGTELRYQYVVGYRPKTLLRDGKWHTIRVKFLPPRGLPRAQVNAKKGYYAPGH